MEARIRRRKCRKYPGQPATRARFRDALAALSSLRPSLLASLSSRASEPAVFAPNDPPQLRSERLSPLPMVPLPLRDDPSLRPFDEVFLPLHRALDALDHHLSADLAHRALHVLIAAHEHPDARRLAPGGPSPRRRRARAGKRREADATAKRGHEAIGRRRRPRARVAGCSNGEVGAAPNARAIPANTPRTGAEEMSAAVGAATRADARPAALESRQTRSTQRILVVATGGGAR